VKFKPYPKYKPSGVEWLPRVPEGWSVFPLKWLVTQLNQKPEAGADADEYVGMENIESFSGKWIPGSSTADPSGLGNIFEAGDVLFGKLRPYLAKAWHANRSGLCSSELLVLRPRTIDGRFLLQQVLNQEFITLVDSSTYGSKMPRASWDFIGAIPLPVPSRDEQQAIAAFLDRETAKIDTLITKQEKLIELLKEKRQAVISHAVTKGLDPTVPMKPSGVEWLGDVPEHWEVSGFTKYLGPIIDYRGRTPTKTEDGVLLLTARNIKNGAINYEASQEFISIDEYPSVMQRGLPQMGEVLFTMEAPLGQVANIDRTDIALAQRIVKFNGLPDFVNNYFLKYWIMGTGCQVQLEQLATGSTALGIKSSKLGQIRISLPPVTAQEEIVLYLDAALSKIDSLIRKAEQAIVLQREHRTALISAAVTGKIDVREAAFKFQQAA
jgi:type I restriction enzyme, S subunit